jgi:hypothetical protein
MPFESLFVAQLEYRERWRRFNARAARGEFVRYTDAEPTTAGLSGAGERVVHLARMIRSAVSSAGLLG